MSKITKILICITGCINALAVRSSNHEKMQKQRHKRDLFIEYYSYDPMVKFWEEREMMGLAESYRLSANQPVKLAFVKNELKHIDKITMRKPGVTACANPCTIKCFHWINSAYSSQFYNESRIDEGDTAIDKGGKFELWDDLRIKHPYYFPYLIDRNGGEKVRVGNRHLINQGPNLLESGIGFNAVDRRPLRQFKQYRFFSKEYMQDKDFVNWKGPMWNAYTKPSAANWSYTLHELATMSPSEWPQDFLGKAFVYMLMEGNSIQAYGKNVGPQGSLKVAERAQEKYEQYYSNTDLAEILGCDPFDRRSCRDISKSYPIEVGHFSPRLGDLGGVRRKILPIQFGQPGKEFGVSDNSYLRSTNGPIAFIPASYIPAGSWFEMTPGLSRVNELLANNTFGLNYNKVLPGFGISNTPKFSSQGYHHDNFLSMSGSWVGKNNKMPQIKFNILPDVTNRLAGVGDGQKLMPLAYTSHVSSISGSSASLDKRRSFDWVNECQRMKAEFQANP